MNPETATVLVGEQTINLAPFRDLPPAFRRPDATGELPACDEVPPARPMRLATEARPGHGRHELAEPWRVALTAELALVIVLAVVIGVLVVGL